MTETRASETIGFIGLGNMGLPMCLNLVDAGYDVVALDLRTEPVAEVVAAGGHTAADVAAVAAAADILLTSLPRPDHVASLDRVNRESLSLSLCGTTLSL